MAPLVKRRHSTRRSGKRKAAISLSLPTLTKKEGILHLSHRAVIEDGYYVYNGKKLKKA